MNKSRLYEIVTEGALNLETFNQKTLHMLIDTGKLFSFELKEQFDKMLEYLAMSKTTMPSRFFAYLDMVDINVTHMDGIAYKKLLRQLDGAWYMYHDLTVIKGIITLYYDMNLYDVEIPDLMNVLEFADLSKIVLSKYNDNFDLELRIEKLFYKLDTSYDKRVSWKRFKALDELCKVIDSDLFVDSYEGRTNINMATSLLSIAIKTTYHDFEGQATRERFETIKAAVAGIMGTI